MSSLSATVFGYILPSNIEGMDYARNRLTVEHFGDEGPQKTLWTVLVNYADRFGGVFTGSHLASLLEQHKVAKEISLLLTEYYNSYVAAEVQEHSFKFAVEALNQQLLKKKTGRILTTAYEILERGYEIDEVTYVGEAEAREYVASKLSELESEIPSQEEAPEGDMRLDMDRLGQLYLDRKSTDVQPGITFGIDSLDNLTGGTQPGELCLIAAYTNTGKSQMCAQTAWHSAVVEGKPVLFATSETVRDVTMRRILARHSRLPQFGLPQGLDLKKIKNSTLTKDEEDVWNAVRHDFKTNSNYAPLHISQIPRGATLNYIEARANAVNRQIQIELLVMDYLQLLKPVTKRSGEREEYNEILRDTKTFAVGFDKGRGIPFISPWQMGRDAYKTALTIGAYGIGGLSDTSEAEKSADLIITILRPEPTANEAFIQVLKNRDGPLMDPQTVFLDFRCAYLGESMSAPVLSNPAAGLVDDFITEGLAGF